MRAIPWTAGRFPGAYAEGPSGGCIKWSLDLTEIHGETECLLDGHHQFIYVLGARS